MGMFSGIFGNFFAGGGLPSITPSKSTYLVTASQSAIIAALSAPFAGLGLGTTTYQVFGTAPAQLAVSGSNVVVGSGASSAGTGYGIDVLAVSGDGSRQLGQLLTFTAQPDVPAAPTIGSVTASSGQLSVPFTDGAANGSAITSHDIFRGTSSGAETLLTGGYTGGSPFVDTSVTNGQQYFYQVRARNGVGPGPLSGEVSGTPAAAVFTQPYNTHAIMGPGDSRTALGGGVAGTYGTGIGVTNYSYGSGTGLDDYVSTFTGNLIRFGNQPNPGIGGQTGAQALAYPRPLGPPGATWTGRIDSGTAGTAGNTLTITGIGGGDQLSLGVQISGPGITPCTITALGTGTGGTGTYTVSGSAQNVASTSTIQPNYLYQHPAAKTLADTAANEAAIVFIWLGTNNSGNGATGLNSDLAAIDAAINALTNPSYVHPGYGAVLPLYNGQPKTVVLLNETRRGITATNTVNNQLSTANAAAFANYAATLKRYSFDSGNATYANGHVVVVDTFNDSTLAQTSDTSTYNPLPGLFADGLHPAPPGGFALAKVVGARLASVLTSVATYGVLPTTATAANYFTSNPCFTTTSGGASSLGSTTLTGTIPSGWRLIMGSASGLTVAISYNALGGNLGNEIILHVTGTPSADILMQFGQLVPTSITSAMNLATDTYRLMGNMKAVFASGAGVLGPNFYATIATAASNPNGMSAGLGFVGTKLGYGNNSAFGLFAKNNYPSIETSTYLNMVTRNINIGQYGATGAPGGNAIQMYMTSTFVSGVAVDATFTLSQCAIAKVTD